MSIHIRKAKATKKGRIRLSLELNYHCKTWFESLNIFLYEHPKTPLEREHNKSINLRAEKTRIIKMSEFENNEAGVPTAYRGRESFTQYFKKLTNEKYNVEGNYATWEATYKHLLDFADGQDTKFKDCNDDFLNRFRNFLLNTKSRKSDTDLSINSANVYLSKVKAALNRAQVERIVTDNPSSRIKNISREETEREYLSHDELVRLKETDCECPLLKKAFIFSCQTGLRWSDVDKLKWKEIVFTKQDDKWKIHHTQQKTGKKQYHPIKKQAVELLGKFGATFIHKSVRHPNQKVKYLRQGFIKSTLIRDLAEKESISLIRQTRKSGIKLIFTIGEITFPMQNFQRLSYLTIKLKVKLKSIGRY